MKKAIALSVLLVALVTVWTLKFVWLPESTAKSPEEPSRSTSPATSPEVRSVIGFPPLDENNYPESQRVYVPMDVTSGAYFRFLDSLAFSREEFRGLNMPGDRLIVLANTWILDSLTNEGPDASEDHIIIPARSRLNIPDRATALSLMQTMRQSILQLDTARQLMTIRYGTDTLFCTSAYLERAIPPEAIVPINTNGMVTVSHRRTRFPGPPQAIRPCLEIGIGMSDQRSGFLIGSAPETGKDIPINLIHVAPADIWIIHYLAPPGTPFRIN